MYREEIRRPRDAEGGVQTQGNRAGQGCQSMVPSLRVSYWGDWAEMRTSWGSGFRVKVREGGGVLNNVFFPPDGGSPSRDGGEFGPCPLLRVVLRVGSVRVWGLGPWLPSDSPGCTGGHSWDQTSEARQECGLHTPLPRRNSTRTSMNSWKIKFKRTFP